MTYHAIYREDEPTREAIDQTTGLWLVEFGASWCGHCQAVSGPLAELLDQYPQVTHLRIGDGRGKPLGRSFRVKLWPTLVFLRDGSETQRLVRPAEEELRRVMEEFAQA